MSDCNAKSTISEEVLSAVFQLQQLNGVSVVEIADFVAEKISCNPCKLRRPVKQILNRAKAHGIMSECRGEFKIEGRYNDRMKDKGLESKLTDGQGGSGAGDGGTAGLVNAQSVTVECREAYSWPDGEEDSKPSFKRRRTYRDVVTRGNGKFRGGTSIGKRL